jgi:DNA-binding beta-propeller fold protein YncE
MSRRNACMACMLVALLAPFAGRSAAQPPPASQQSIDQGIRVRFDTAQPAHAGDAVGFRFQLSDTAGDTPLRGLRPAAWLSQRAPGAAAPNCKTQTANFLGGDLFKRADIDLNSFFVLTLNDDATVSVVDPMFSFGGSKLLNLLQLESRGADWLLVAEQSRLFVSMPDAGAVALIDTRQWRIIDTIRTGPHPRRLALAGNRIWVADDRGLSGIDIATLAVTVLPLASGAADLAASDNGEWLFAASGNGIAVIDAYAARVTRQAPLDGQPGLLAYSRAAQAVYAADTRQGKLYAIDASPHATRPAAVVKIRPGAAQLRFTPDGRYALLPVPGENLLQVLDTASNRLAHNVPIADGPNRVSFSDRIAYVRRRDSEIVLMIQLEQLGNQSRALGIADFTGGQKAFGNTGEILADGQAGAPDGGSVLVVNPDDRMVYLYREGMAAPAGGFHTYAQTPRAVMVVDHGLREVGQGAYATTMPVKQAGLYDVVLFNDAPRVLTCFSANIGADGDATPRRLVKVDAVEPPAQLTTGHHARLRFALSDADGHPLKAASDVRALALAPPGIWQRRLATTTLPDNSYEIEFTPPQAGVYYVWIESESLGLPRNNPQFKMFQVFSQENNHEQ